MKHLIVKSVLLLGMPLSLSSAVQANDWWFDVEILLYKQDQSLQALQEHFPQPASVDISDTTDLLSPFLRPDISVLRNSLPLCDAPLSGHNLPAIEFTNTEIIGLLNQIEQINQQIEKPGPASEPVTPEADAQIVGQLSAPGQPNQAAQQSGFNINRWLRSDCVLAAERRWLKDLLFPAQSSEAMITSVPTVINDKERRFNNQPHLLPASQMNLKDIARDLHRQRGIRPLLHLVWRQPVLFGRDEAEKYRLFGGVNFAQSYDNLGYLLQSSEQAESEQTVTSEATDTDLIRRVEQALAQPLILAEQDIEALPQGKKVDQLWELDGWFKVYLQYINRVPYLHVDSELIYRAEGPPGLMQQSSLATESQFISQDNLSADETENRYQLYSLPFQQLRRVISTQIHYFDHPMFGMVVQLRRYHKPEPAAEESE
ncbi:CsiV family protein [Lacimicrobium alkaliphilum]|uniref:Peptidoglycan-binding protein CsiV n=1 Tax=Lacimicrobium alkaliphilum TaxID=1526571 RepID=A0A0U2ZKF0_9ALTE|nr:CsiV family protein [Lacimicrobium alkaliphilum]ALS98812.1 hypothetical protein AT746_11380 [Lacimicrobium alkaliphilum]